MSDSTPHQDSGDEEHQAETKSDVSESDREELSIDQAWIDTLEDVIAQSGRGQVLERADEFERSRIDAKVEKLKAEDVTIEGVEFRIAGTEAEEEEESESSRWDWIRNVAQDGNARGILALLLLNQLAFVVIQLVL